MSFIHIRKLVLKEPCGIEESFFEKQTIVKVEYPDAHIDFRIESSGTNKVDVFMIKVFGVSWKMFNHFDVKLKNKIVIPMILEAGYRDNYGEIFVGTVENIEYKKDRNENYVVIKGTKNGRKMLDVMIDMNWNKGVDLKTIVRDVAKKAGYNIKKLNIPDEKNKIFNQALTLTGTVYDVFSKIIDDPDTTFNFDSFNLSVFQRSDKVEEFQFINFLSGLISSPRVDKDGYYSFEMFLNHKISRNYSFAIPFNKENRISDSFDSDDIRYYKVVDYVHDADGNGVFQTNVKCQLTSSDEAEAKKIYKENYEYDDKTKFE